MTTFRRDLRDEIVAEPDDLGLRRVYADFLVERGDPQGQFIHLQLMEKRTPEVLAAEAELLKRYHAHWIQPIRAGHGSARFGRGLVEEWGARADEVIARGTRVARAHPLRALSILAPSRTQLEHLTRLKITPRLRSLELRALSFDPCQVLATVFDFDKLERLALHGGAAPTLAALLRTAWFARVRELEVSMPISQTTAEAIAPALARLVTLQLHGVVPVSEAPRLKWLKLTGVEPTDEKLFALLAKAPELHTLELAARLGTGVPDALIEALPRSLVRLVMGDADLDVTAGPIRAQLWARRSLRAGAARRPTLLDRARAWLRTDIPA